MHGFGSCIDLHIHRVFPGTTVTDLDVVLGAELNQMTVNEQSRGIFNLSLDFSLKHVAKWMSAV